MAVYFLKSSENWSQSQRYANVLRICWLACILSLTVHYVHSTMFSMCLISVLKRIVRRKTFVEKKLLASMIIRSDHTFRIQRSAQKCLRTSDYREISHSSRTNLTRQWRFVRNVCAMSNTLENTWEMHQAMALLQKRHCLEKRHCLGSPNGYLIFF